MGDVMIKCPETGKAIRTGMSMDKGSFDSSTLTNNSVGCSECGGSHTWSKEDSWLKD
jgi:hypothetical protein